MERTWSGQQAAIFDWFVDGKGNLVVRARAGTGKTTVIIEGVRRAPSSEKIMICAFSKIIQEELLKRIGSGHPNVTAKTLHAIGLACVTRYRERIKVSFKGERAEALTDAVCGKAPDAIKRLVSKLHTKGREIAPHATAMGDLTSIAITFECEPDENWIASGFGLDYVEEKALAAMELASQVKSGETIDGSDMIFLPVRNGWMRPEYDLVVVDEAQDMTQAQLELALGVRKPNGRMCIVGDDRQAIFGFRGADSGSLDRLKAELGAKELGLTTTYRCGREIVALAARYVPDFEAGADNPLGSVETLATGKLVAAAGPGDFILSRVNAPLVSVAMKLLRSGKRTRVAGRDIGTGLINLIRKMKGRSVPDLLSKIESWARKESHRVEVQMASATNGRKKAFESKLETIADQADMLSSLTEGAENVTEVTDRIEHLFTDDGMGVAGMITCSSVHRAKGLEAKRVFVLQDTLRVNNIEEENITYVAITRAKESLVWVTDNAVEVGV